MPKEQLRLYVIVRVHEHIKSLDKHDYPLAVKVTKIVLSEEIADSEVERLNSLNSEKDYTYFWDSQLLKD